MLDDKEKRREWMMVIKKTFHIEKHHKNRKMTCHAESRETVDLHSDGAGGVEGLVSFLAVEEHVTLRFQINHTC